jgi:hypothetical protein
MIAIVSPPRSPTRFKPVNAVPVPQARQAPTSNDMPSGIGTSVSAGTTMYSAWPPWAVPPYPTTPASQSCGQPDQQCTHRPQPE